MLARRFIHIPDFEAAHNYKYDKEKGKPLSAYEFVQTISIEESIPIVNFIKCILGNEPQLDEFSQENVQYKYHPEVVG